MHRPKTCKERMPEHEAKMATKKLARMSGPKTKYHTLDHQTRKALRSKHYEKNGAREMARRAKQLSDNGRKG